MNIITQGYGDITIATQGYGLGLASASATSGELFFNPHFYAPEGAHYGTSGSHKISSWLNQRRKRW